MELNSDSDFNASWEWFDSDYDAYFNSDLQSDTSDSDTEDGSEAGSHDDTEDDGAESGPLLSQTPKITFPTTLDNKSTLLVPEEAKFLNYLKYPVQESGTNE